MQAFFIGLFGWIASSLIARVLTGAGLALVGSYSFGIFIDYFLQKALVQLSFIPNIGLIGLAGIDKAISILISSVLIRVYISSVASSLKLVAKK